jgi:predicted small lipoprotein YifL
MTRKIGAFVALAAAVLVAAGGLVGCGPKPPCEVSPAQVDAAKAACVKSQAAVEEARNQRTALEAQTSKVKTDIAELEGTPSELADRLELLKKGSGR